MALATFSGLPLRARIAWNSERRACLALPPALSPSTRNSSFRAGSLPLQAANFLERETSIRSPPFFCPVRASSSAIWASLRAFWARWIFLIHSLPWPWLVSNHSASPSVTTERDDPLDRRVVQPVLGLALELGVRQLHRDDGGEALLDDVRLQGLLRTGP